MASSLLASTAILIALGILNTAVRPAGFQEITHALNIVGTHSETLWLIKLMLLAVDFFLFFFNFTLAIRYFNHAGYGLGLPDTHVGVASHELVVEVVNHASLALYHQHALLLSGHTVGIVGFRPDLDAHRVVYSRRGALPA